jgi:hypothetical protein
VLLEKDIPFKRPSPYFGTELSATDPENLERYFLDDAMRDMAFSMSAAATVIKSKQKQATAWANAILDRWVPLSSLLG